MPSVIHGQYETQVKTLKSSAAETASTNGSAVSIHLRTYPVTQESKGTSETAQVYLDITAASGTAPTLDVKIQGRLDANATWTDLVFFPRFVTTGTAVAEIKGPLPVDLRYVSTITGTTPSFTYSVRALLGG